MTVVLSFQGGYPLTTNLAAEHVLTGMGPAEKTLTDLQQPSASKRAAFAAGLRRSVALLQDAGKPVVVVIDVPELPFEPRGCLARPVLGRQVANCSVSQADVIQRQGVLREVLGSIAAERSGLQLFDTLPVLCTGGRCPIERDGTIMMRDSHHLSDRGSAHVVAALMRQLPSP